MKEVLDFLNETGVFFISTIDGDQPTVRPFAFFMEYEGKFYFGTSETRSAYKHLKSNPKFQIATPLQNMSWMRITGKAHLDERPEVFEVAVIAQPQTFAKHKESPDPNFKPVFYYIEEGEAIIYTLPNQEKHIKL